MDSVAHCSAIVRLLNVKYVGTIKVPNAMVVKSEGVGSAGPFQTRHGLSLHVRRLVGLLTGRSKALVISVPSCQHGYVSVGLYPSATRVGKDLVRCFSSIFGVKSFKLSFGNWESIS